MTQRELAAALGYKTLSSIAKIEKDVNCPPLNKLREFARILEVDLQDLIGTENDRTLTREERWEKANIQRQNFRLREAKNATDIFRAFLENPETLTDQQLQYAIDLCEHIQDWFRICACGLKEYMKRRR